MSLRKIAKILGISPTYLSLLLNGKRPWRGNLKERYEELVNTFVNTNGGQSEIEEERNLTSIPKSLVGRQGFEPWTLGLKVRCSARLSYRPVYRLVPESGRQVRKALTTSRCDINPVWRLPHQHDTAGPPLPHTFVTES